MKKVLNIVLCCTILFFILLFNVSSGLTIFADTATGETLSMSEYSKIAEGLNLTNHNDTLDMGTGYKIFNVNNPDFLNLFLVTEYSHFTPLSVTGHSASDFAENYDKATNKDWGVNFGIQSTKNPFAKVGFNISKTFDTKIGSDLRKVRDEYYETYDVYKPVKIAQIDWKNAILGDVFSTEFKKDLANVVDIESAIPFLNKYGTHLFDNYYFGGALSLGRYICSEDSIASSYESMGKSFDLGADVSSAISSNKNDSESNITENEINNSETKTKTHLSVYGGKGFNALNAEDLFTWKQEYFSKYQSGYVYTAWLESIDRYESLFIINAEKPVSLWDVLLNNKICDKNVYFYLKKAFDIMALGEYGKKCNDLNVSSDFISSLNYDFNGSEASFTIQDDTILLPENESINFNYGNLLRNSFNLSDIQLKIVQGLEYATLENNTLFIKDNTLHQTIVLKLYVYNYEFYTINIKVEKGDFRFGYGTKGQPYLITDIADWNLFFTSPKYYDGTYFKLISDLDLMGYRYDSGGSTSKSGFFSNFDGLNHTITNASFENRGHWENSGIFGVNKGTIKNLNLNNIKIYNSIFDEVSQEGYLSETKRMYNSGILVGHNSGIIENVHISNSSIRFVGSININGHNNIGGIAGYNNNLIKLSSISHSNILGIAYDGGGQINSGGIAGMNINGTIEHCLVNNNSVNVNVYNSYNEGDYFANKTNHFLYKFQNGKWENIGYCGVKDPKFVKITNAKYYINIKDQTFFEKNDKGWTEGKQINTKLYISFENPVEIFPIYTLGGIVGYASKNSEINYTVCYENSFSTYEKRFGNVAGLSKDFDGATFINCIFESQSLLAVNGNSHEGCYSYRKIDINAINSSEWKKYWCVNSEGKVVLK